MRVKYFLIFIAFSLLISCSKKKPVETPIPKVKIAEIKSQEVPIYIDAIGQVIASSTVNIRPQVAGKLINAFVKQGALVEEGELLYEIDPRPYQAALDEAIAQQVHDEVLLSYAEDVVQRYKQVVEEDYISVINYEQFVSNAGSARAQVELDKAAVRGAQLNVNFCKIVAPVTGKISYSNVYVGNILAVDDPTQITTLLPLSPINIMFSVPQSQFELIRKEQGDAGYWPFIASLPDSPQNTHSATTYFIDNQINQNTGTILLKGELPNETLDLWPGAFVRVKVLHKMVPQSLTVPPSAVLQGKDGPYIYLVDKEDKAQAVNVVVLTKADHYTAIQSEKAHTGDRVIVDGQINIAPGVKVKVDTTP